MRPFSRRLLTVLPAQSLRWGSVLSKEDLPTDPYTSKVAGVLRKKVYAKDYSSAGLTEKEEQIITEWRNPHLGETAAKSAEPDDIGDVRGEPSEGSVDVAGKHGATFRDQRPIDPNEDPESKRRRLIFQSRYRGMVEMDLIFGHFARTKLESLDAALLDEYDLLLKQLDSDLFRWLIVGEKAPDNIENSKCYHALKDFIENERTELLGNY